MKIVNTQNIKMNEHSTEKTARTYTWDFTGVDAKTVASIAVRDLVIRIAQMHRAGKTIPKSGATISVAAMVKGQPLMTPAETVAAAIPHMTDEEKAEAIKQLSA